MRSQGSPHVGVSQHRPIARAVAAAFVAVLSTACVRPTAVASFAAAAGRTSAQLPDVASDLYASCLRFEGYKAARRGDGWYEPADLAPPCAGRDSAVRRVVAMNRVLAGYWSALGALADDRVVGYDKELARLATALNADAGVPRDRARGVTGLAAFLGTAVTEAYRRGQLERAIESQHENVALVVEGLHEIFATDYANALEVEHQGMALFYHALWREAATREPIAAALLRDARDERDAALVRKQAALADLADALRDVRAGHERLYASRHDLNAPALVGDLATYAARLDAAVRALQKAF